MTSAGAPAGHCLLRQCPVLTGSSTKPASFGCSLIRAPLREKDAHADQDALTSATTPPAQKNPAGAMSSIFPSVRKGQVKWRPRVLKFSARGKCPCPARSRSGAGTYRIFASCRTFMYDKAAVHQPLLKGQETAAFSIILHTAARASCIVSDSPWLPDRCSAISTK